LITSGLCSRDVRVQHSERRFAFETNQMRMAPNRGGESGDLSENSFASGCAYDFDKEKLS